MCVCTVRLKVIVYCAPGLKFRTAGEGEKGRKRRGGIYGRLAGVGHDPQVNRENIYRVYQY